MGRRRRRLLRILLNAATAVSLVLSIATAVLWAMSYGTRPRFWLIRDTGPDTAYQVVVWDGRATFEWDTRPTPRTFPGASVYQGRNLWQRKAPGVTVERNEMWPADVANQTIYRRSLEIHVWFWLPTLATAIPPLIWVWRRRSNLRQTALRLARGRRAARVTAGHCPACGYDLRATPDRCPECGTVPTAAPPAR